MRTCASCLRVTRPVRSWIGSARYCLAARKALVTVRRHGGAPPWGCAAMGVRRSATAARGCLTFLARRIAPSKSARSVRTGLPPPYEMSRQGTRLAAALRRASKTHTAPITSRTGQHSHGARAPAAATASGMPQFASLLCTVLPAGLAAHGRASRGRSAWCVWARARPALLPLANAAAPRSLVADQRADQRAAR